MARDAEQHEASQHVTVVAGMGPERAHVFAVLVKRSYAIRNGQPLAEAPAEPFLQTDLYHEPGDPEICTIRREEERAPWKLATDVVVLAEAHPPEGRPAQQTTIGVEVAGRRRVLSVTGDRKAIHRGGHTPNFTDPRPFTTMPMRYERAYGGADLRSLPEAPFHYPRNTHGRGVALRNNAEAVEGLPLPNIEDPEDLLTPERLVMGEPARWNDMPMPAGIGFLHRTWYPRCSFVAALPPYVDVDTVLREELLGLVPKGQIALGRAFRLPSFDLRFHSAASLGLVVPDLAPGAAIRLARLSPEPMLSFTLPLRWPRIGLDIGPGMRELPSALHTVLVDVAALQVHMIWRGAQAYPGPSWLPSMRKLEAMAT